MTSQLESIKEFLKELDAQLPLDTSHKLYLIGGAAITLGYDHQNRTADLDFIEPPDVIDQKGGINSPLSKKYHVYTSSLAEINFSVPPDWRSKCQALSLNLIHLQIMIPCIEDIILGKTARLEPKDFEDIISLRDKKLLDTKRLMARLKENKKELKDPAYRNNAKLLFEDVFRLKLAFHKGEIQAIRM